MDLYIEKDFLDNFYLDYNQNEIQERLKILFTKYGSKRVFIDFKADDFEKIESENEFFALIATNNISPIPVKSIERHLFENSDFNQTLVFTNEVKDWFDKAERKGALCFSFENYQNRISEIINKLHFKIDLIEDFIGWDFLEDFNTIHFNSLVVSDRYILSDKVNQKIEDNIIPILKKMIQHMDREINIEIFTKDLNPIRQSEESKKAKARKRYQKLNRIFSQYNTKFSIILNDFPIIEHILHDRYIKTNFSLMDCGLGFNLTPNYSSDSQIISETIFDMYTYKRLNNIMKIQSQYLQRLQNIDTIKFKMYPEKN